MDEIPLTDEVKQNIFRPVQIIETLIKDHQELISKAENYYKIPTGYLTPHLAIHLPRFAKKELSKKLISEEITRLASRIGEIYFGLDNKWKNLLYMDKEETKIKFYKGNIYIADDNGGFLKEIYFDKVNPSIGNFIQNKLHYIRKARDDTKFHLGFYSPGDKNIPFAYASFSILDRDYLINNLPISLEGKQILVMTRAFGFNFIPHNSMSALFHCCYKFFKRDFNLYKAIVTALNPNLLFKGSIFKGASYFPFALSPLQLIYYNGNYVTRRFCRDKFGSEDIVKLNKEGKIKRAKIPSKDILWLIRGIYPQAQEIIRNLDYLIKISEKEYLNG